MNEMIAGLCCPDCRGPLFTVQDDLGCSLCGPAGKWVDGIPGLTNPNYYWGEIPRENMQEANRLAWEIGFPAAVEWVGMARPVREPRDLQIAFPLSVRELPKPSGFVSVGTENRIGRDAPLRFVDSQGWERSELPRRVRRLACWVGPRAAVDRKSVV